MQGGGVLKLAFLLIGPGAFRSQWSVLALAGAALMGLALLLAASAWAGSAWDWVEWMTYAALGLVFVANGLLALLAGVFATERVERRLGTAKAAASTIAGGLILLTPFQSGWALALLFAVALALDGAARVVSTLLYRYPGWRPIVACGVVELVLALMILMGWPLPQDRNIPLCVGLFIGLSGWLLLRLGVMLRDLEDEAAILMLPVFSGRGWYDNAPILIGADPPRLDEEPPLVVRVWTPAGSIGERARRPLIDRYIAAVDRNGIISTGHSALEMAPDLYISHYPAVEIDHTGQSLLKTLSSKPENDVEGRFLASYAEEVASWCEADASVEFRRFSPRRLRVFWAGYRQDNRYNLTNRNCSVVVAAALDAALEGVLADRAPWLRLARLLADPDLWVAALIRSRASSMTWTPGLVLDYARTLARIVERRDLSWAGRFRDFLARLRAADTSVGAVAS
ncbi:Uncharacterized membrane protein HdeD, DUF308 family [Azospirillum lipoferum]|nr:Uncharacterized membrane protein HdeD, DUF308 family [Azospirillum lipoferum]